MKSISEINEFDANSIFEEVASYKQPVVLRGLAREWPLVQESLNSNKDSSRYLLEFYQGKPVRAFYSEADIGGRIFYTDDLADTNFRQVESSLDKVLDQIHQYANNSLSPTVYMGSTAIDYCLPGLSEQNSLPQGNVDASVRIWIGNRSTVAAHYDVLDNIACVCSGRRRFTLFPPDQLSNLYIGPIDLTPAGQQISLVDLKNPDLNEHPRFSEALKHAQMAELEPGDAIYIPSMWWHHVEGLESLNILINHWWRDAPAYMGAPADALLHAIMNVRDLPQDQRSAWRGIFEHYVFDVKENSVDHIPVDSRGVLGELDEQSARKLRSLLRNKLNR